MIRKHESSHLHRLNTVGVVTQQPRHSVTSDLLQLLQGEAAWPASILVPEPVPVPEVMVLSSNDAGEGLTQQSSWNWILCNTCTEQLQVFWSVVQPLVSGHSSVGHQTSQLVPAGDWFESTKFTITTDRI